MEIIEKNDSLTIPVSLHNPPDIHRDNEKRTRTMHMQTTSDFWTKTPSILLEKWWIVFPDMTMTMNEKLNALTRLIIFLSVLTFIITQRVRILFIGAMTICAIVLFFNVRSKRSIELFTQEMDERVKNIAPNKNTNIFDSPKVGNPFSNILLTDYEYNINKKPAPPIDNPSVNSEVLETAKQTVLSLNRGQPDLEEKLFKNLGDVFDFEQSLRPFCTQPGTTIPNDQNAFMQFCYGSMISCKEGNLFACARNNSLKYINQ
jgi:hypothetical protein